MQEISVRISDEIYERLNILSQKTGRSLIELVNQAIQEHIEKLEENLVSGEKFKDFETEDYSAEDIEKLMQHFYG